MEPIIIPIHLVLTVTVENGQVTVQTSQPLPPVVPLKPEPTFEEAEEIIEDKALRRNMKVDVVTYKPPLKTYPCNKCEHISSTEANLRLHKQAAHATFVTPPKKNPVQFSFGTKVDLKSEILKCPNMECNRREKFVKGTGYMVNDTEWCSQRCHEDWLAIP